jgi:membrane protease YdiL (CAAX protease family)
VLACAIGWFMTTPPWQRFAWRWQDIGWGLVATLPMVIALFAMRHAKSGPLGRLNHVVDTLVAPLFGTCSVIQLFLISTVAGIGEELLFRGVVQPLLAAWLGTVAGVIIASTIFGLLHAVTPTYAILATAVGIYLGGLALVTGNLLGPIIAHSLYDFIALVYLTRAGFASLLAVGPLAEQSTNKFYQSIGDGTHRFSPP